MAGVSELRLGSIDTLVPRVVPHPGATLLSLVADSLGGRDHGVHPRVRRLVRAAVPQGAADVLRPLFAPGFSVIPDCLTPTATMSREESVHHLEQLDAVSTDILLGEIETEFGGDVPAQWRPVVRRPKAWKNAYARLMRSVWNEVAPMWRAAGRLIGRETERVGAATVGGSLDCALADLSPRFRLRGTVLRLPDQQGETFELGGRRLILVPVVSGGGASLFSFDRSDAVWIGYPVPGLGGLWGSDAPRDRSSDALGLLLGETRAAVLHALSGPLSSGEIAARLRYAPATVTYHCTRLEAAGLVERLRCGQHVLVRRTARGEELMDVLGGTGRAWEGVSRGAGRR
ncbi:helix-turn-helix domain-containing protein [Streptomyces sp. TRM43335]|uniref:Helix-turn-helix domain-containing protein n=1 Tax=Streptomyces taklimakanensis TaxID=2569853 RepID=A0A6G2BBW5_9ACTN|nr:winged helix-turn-helix domain-containing protein [Streptomyces taklimakanensis]MTE19740.1 helix-turn-helix domain-containing protein [Streptomyces taklimakanensis]